MIADSLLVPECVYRPGSFTGLMTLYESSYIKLQQLAGEHLTGLGDALSRVEGDCDLHLSVTSEDRYTTSFRLTYWFDVQKIGTEPGQIADPDLSLKAYRDARLLEAVSLAEHHRHHKLRELALSHTAELDRRWQRNMLLNKWLDYLLEMGHRFT
ncbi:MAG TPA: DUF1249 domain-containing protein [Gammaproteobacteria bacterium]|nr:DUF1249 domain-containing protein [Gammaproteobacteria bacterium]